MLNGNLKLRINVHYHTLVREILTLRTTASEVEKSMETLLFEYLHEHAKVLAHIYQTTTGVQVRCLGICACSFSPETTRSLFDQASEIVQRHITWTLDEALKGSIIQKRASFEFIAFP